jgi:hypothetical protein
MTTRVRVDPNASQIVFDATGDETQLKSMMLAIPNRPHVVKSGNDSFMLRTDDIPDAQHVPTIRVTRNLMLDTSDIAGTSSKPMFDKSKPPVDLLRVNDIDGSRPRIVRQLPHSNRCLNPVDPQYNLPSKPEEVIPPPKFIRDHMYNGDVEGAQPAPLFSSKPPRDIMRIDDVVGTSPVRCIREVKREPDSFNVKDINNDGIFKTTRTVDPLNPVYFYDGQWIRSEDFGKARPPKTPHAGPDRRLVVADIDGTEPGASLKRYRAFRQPPPPREEDETKPPKILMVPSMVEQTKELELQQAIMKYRGDKIRACESRNVRRNAGTGDPVEGILRRHETFDKCLRG